MLYYIIIYYNIIYNNIIYNNFINGFLETLVRRKNPFLCKNVKMRFLRYCLRGLKRLSEVVIE